MCSLIPVTARILIFTKVLTFHHASCVRRNLVKPARVQLLSLKLAMLHMLPKLLTMTYFSSSISSQFVEISLMVSSLTTMNSKFMCS